MWGGWSPAGPPRRPVTVPPTAQGQTGAGEVGHCWQDSKHQARWGSSMGSRPGDLNTFSLSIAGKKQTPLQSRIPGAPLHTRDHYLPYRETSPSQDPPRKTPPKCPAPGPPPQCPAPCAGRQTRTGEVPQAWHHRRPAGRAKPVAASALGSHLAPQRHHSGSFSYLDLLWTLIPPGHT